MLHSDELNPGPGDGPRARVRVAGANKANYSGLNFVISSYCHSGGCVGVAPLPDGGVAVSDTKTADGPILEFTAAEWDAFLRGVTNGEFDEDTPLRSSD